VVELRHSIVRGILFRLRLKPLEWKRLPPEDPLFQQPAHPHRLISRRGDDINRCVVLILSNGNIAVGRLGEGRIAWIAIGDYPIATAEERSEPAPGAAAVEVGLPLWGKGNVQLSPL